MSSRILVTGGNGYVGREVTRLLYDNHEVCVVDCVRGGRIRFSKEELDKIHFARVDIADQLALNKLMSDFSPNTVIHLAAIHYIPECETDPARAVATNVSGTINVLLASPLGAHFVYASSGAVYKPDRRPHKEATSKLEPSDVYGLSKLHGEQYVRNLTAKRELSSVVVRLFNVVGPGETNPHLLPEIVAQLKAGRRTVRLGNLWPRRDYIHVRDAARGFVATAMGNSVSKGDTLTVNLGTSLQYSVATVVEKLRKVAEIPFELEEDGGRVRKVDRPFLAADNTQIRSRFGWSPELTIDDALADLWHNPDLSADLIAKYQ